MDERTLLAAAQAANEFQKERRPSDVNAAGGMGGRRRSFQFNDPALIPEEVLDKRAARKSDSWLKWIGKTLSGKNPGDADFDGLDVAVDEAAPITFGRSRRRSQRAVSAFFHQMGESRRLTPGESLITPGKQNSCLYLLVEGELETTHQAPGSEARAVIDHATNELIGFESFLLGTLPERGVRVPAESPRGAQILQISIDTVLMTIMGGDASLAVHLFHEVAAEMAERIRTRASRPRPTRTRHTPPETFLCLHSAETRSDGLRESVQKIAPTATSLTHENRLNARAAQKESASVDAGPRR